MLLIAFAEYLTKSDVYLIIPLLCVNCKCVNCKCTTLALQSYDTWVRDGGVMVNTAAGNKLNTFRLYYKRFFVIIYRRIKYTYTV